MKNKIRYIFAALTAIIVSGSAFAQNINNANTNKTARVNPDGTVTLTLDTWINGYESNIWKESTVAVPLDIVLVLDVSGSMTGTISNTEITYTALQSKNYSFSDLKNKDYYIKDGENYYKIQRDPADNVVIYSQYYRLYYTKEGTRYYLYNNGITTTPPNVTKNDTKVWRGVLYTRQENTTYQSKLKALQNACAKFVDDIAAKAVADKVEHRIAVVKFASNKSNDVGNDRMNNSDKYNYTQIVNNLTTNYSTVKKNINSLVAAGATSVDWGLEHAQTIIKAAVDAKSSDEIRKGSKQVVVMFTDGEPNHRSGFDRDVASDAIKTSKIIKGLGATVYTVGVFDNPSNDVHTYMHYVSSNVTDATSMPKRSNITTPSGKYITASSAEELDAIFEAISQKIIIDTEGEEASTEIADKISILDIVTEQFTIPEVGDGTYDIRLYEVKPTDVKVKSNIARDDKNFAPLNVSDCYDITWEAKGTPIVLGEKDSVVVNTEYNTLEVKGVLSRFIKDKKWVGVKEEWTDDGNLESSAINNNAAMLRIEFEIVPNENWDGGLAYTNTNESGIYLDGVEGHPYKLYNVPDMVCLPANLTIRKSGMNPGETAIFEVTASGYEGGVTKKYTVAMTADETGTFKDAVIMKVDIAKNSQPGADDPGYLTYTVKETSWSWAYNSIPTGEGADEAKHCITRQVGDSEESRIFVFDAKPKTDSPKHAENSANNVFAK